MPKMKPRLTAKEQAEAFEREAQKRRDDGQPSAAEADDALDAAVKRSISLHGA